MNFQSRRNFLKTSLGAAASLSLCPSFEAVAATGNAKNAKAKSVIYLYMKGGMSHLDTFDMKPKNREVQGPVSPIKTSESGVVISENLPRLAKHMHEIAQIRTMSHTQGNHEPGIYYSLTGYPMEAGVIVHPSIGSWVSVQSEKLNPNLPLYVRNGGLSGHPASGFFEIQHAPLPISDPERGLQNSVLPKNISQNKFQRNLSVLSRFDKDFMNDYGAKNVRAYADLYKDAVAMMSSPDLAAFNIKSSPKSIREKYGKSSFGKGCLLAKQLVEKGVRFVEVDYGGWDSHTDNHKQVGEKCPDLDQGLSALLEDLKVSGLLDSTLVVLNTEFGRSPNIDEYKGRDHHPFAYTTLMAGAGINGGAIYGKTDGNGSRPLTEPTSAHDFNATIAWALGLDYEHYESPFAGGQKFSISGKDTAKRGKPLKVLFS